MSLGIDFGFSGSRIEGLGFKLELRVLDFPPFCPRPVVLGKGLQPHSKGLSAKSRRFSPHVFHAEQTWKTPHFNALDMKPKTLTPQIRQALDAKP